MNLFKEEEEERSCYIARPDPVLCRRACPVRLSRFASGTAASSPRFCRGRAIPAQLTCLVLDRSLSGTSSLACSSACSARSDDRAHPNVRHGESRYNVGVSRAVRTNRGQTTIISIGNRGLSPNYANYALITF